MRYLKEQKEFYDEVERIHKQSENKNMFDPDNEDGSESVQDQDQADSDAQDPQLEDLPEPDLKTAKQAAKAQKQK